MSASPNYSGQFSSSFCLMLQWVTYLFEDELDAHLLMADDESGHVVLTGDPDHCETFQFLLMKLCKSAIEGVENQYG